mmetsp:Transcript_797/g.2758  ORF Transcript_797/g.2758 Transcript_797/m.2758 type:complete len:293 (-) Transcript_797:753-1631(-)|eukprot:CAMPEP_0174835662 /NCGR_PEP_ID=MMETSP1114-20130205/5522_1 /TAXON_ID=312471 /ORGANISM="Neobodo designis, Strain CCAP 1951/1" /LENGTH=292 /DNA_ID=CAMNT_0016069615 /DNA_START=699 /DNA_END=1577 /DNA_ORIENTATION=+
MAGRRQDTPQPTPSAWPPLPAETAMPVPPPAPPHAGAGTVPPPWHHVYHHHHGHQQQQLPPVPHPYWLGGWHYPPYNVHTHAFVPPPAPPPPGPYFAPPPPPQPTLPIMPPPTSFPPSVNLNTQARAGLEDSRLNDDFERQSSSDRKPSSGDHSSRPPRRAVPDVGDKPSVRVGGPRAVLPPPPATPDRSRPERYKTAPCRFYARGVVCYMGATCRFAHGESDRRTEEQNTAEGLTSQEALDALLLARAAEARASGIRPGAVIAAAASTAHGRAAVGPPAAAAAAEECEEDG